MFKNIFGRNRTAGNVDVSKIGCDMHSHLIPGIDDGSPNIATSVGLIKAMGALGYRKLITTPHVMSDMYRNNPEIINQRFCELAEALANEDIKVEIEVAAEYLIDDGFGQKLKKGEILTFGDRFILIELPYFYAPPMFNEMLFELQVNGYQIILAHPERYQYWHNDIDIYHRLIDRGVFFQLNILSLSGHYSPKIQRMGEKLIDLNMIDFLGSDLHNFKYLQFLKDSLKEPYLHKVIESGRLKNHLL